MKFEAKKIDLTLELTTLSGEEITLTPRKLVTAEETVNILRSWTAAEKNAKTNVDRVELLAKELSILYPKEKEWFLSNFDMTTLSDMLNFVASSIGGIRKNAESSS